VNITVRETVRVEASPERVWDFTQDWSRRAEWDPAVRAAEALSRDGGPPSYRVRGAGGLSFVARYKLFERPARTSLEMAEPTSRLVVGGGGAWTYAPDGAGTRWTQVNTLALRDGLAGALLRPLVRWQLARVTRVAMRRAKRLIEE
jgi:uncharacterized protein YndB with AHSA1/START domain